MNHRLYELAYVSSATHNFGPGALKALLSKARRNNAVRDISGLLLYSDHCFMQVLEGEYEQVKQLMQTIFRDPRHANLLIVHEGRLAQRNFPHWRMGYQQLNAEQQARVEGLSDFLREDSSERAALAGRQSPVYQLLNDFRQCSAVVPELRSAS